MRVRMLQPQFVAGRYRKVGEEIDVAALIGIDLIDGGDAVTAGEPSIGEAVPATSPPVKDRTKRPRRGAKKKGGKA